MEILHNFGIQPTLLIAQIVNFLIILFVLKKFFYKPIIKVLEDRKKRIEESLANADLIEQRLTETDEKITQILEEARNNAQEIITNARSEAERIMEQAQNESKKTLEETLLAAKEQAETERQAMEKKLEKETLSLVERVVRRLLARNLNQKERHDLTSRSIRDIIS